VIAPTASLSVNELLGARAQSEREMVAISGGREKLLVAPTLTGAW
jgi:hypothetical protein